MRSKSACTGVSTVAVSFAHVDKMRMRSLSLSDWAFEERLAATFSSLSAILVSLLQVFAVQPSLDKMFRKILVAMMGKCKD